MYVISNRQFPTLFTVNRVQTVTRVTVHDVKWPIQVIGLDSARAERCLFYLYIDHIGITSNVATSAGLRTP